MPSLNPHVPGGGVENVAVVRGGEVASTAGQAMLGPKLQKENRGHSLYVHTHSH